MNYLAIMLEETSRSFFLGWLCVNSCAATVGEDQDEAAMYMAGGEL